MKYDISSTGRDPSELVRNAVLNAYPQHGERSSRWAAVRQSLGVGCTTATMLCELFGKDPEEILGPVFCEGCQYEQEEIDR